MPTSTFTRHPYANHFHALDGLRGVAAVAVVILHGMELLGNPRFIPHSAPLAVDFFFMLSGFVLAHAYEDRLSTGKMSWWDFVVVRLIRLYPLVLASTILGGAVLLLGELHKTHRIDLLVDAPIFIGAALMLPSGLATHAPIFHTAYPLNFPEWSLFFELAAGVIYGTRASRLGRTGMICVVVLSALCLVVATSMWRGKFKDIGFDGPISFLLGFVRVSYPFWMGVALYRFAKWRSLISVPFVVLSFTLGTVLLMPFGGKLFALTVILFFFPALVALGARTHVPSSLVWICSFLGELSYPVYLINQPVFRIVKNLQLGLSPIGMIALGVLLTIVGAQILLIAYDRPVRRWLNLKLRTTKFHT
jgi:peptidoglycan/LPS O-acetylase OafA/YrhL